MNIDCIEKVLLKLAKRAYRKGEVPVAAIVVKDGKIISKSYNKRNNTNNPLKHAEIEAILKATRKIGDWRLDNCDLYVTLEPCNMCKELIKETRINNCYYYISKTKIINRKSSFVRNNNSFSEKYEELLTSFFKELR